MYQTSVIFAYRTIPDTPPHEIFCGYEHTFALTSDGDVLGFGNGIKGQLGIGNTGEYKSSNVANSKCFVANSQYRLQKSKICPCLLTT